MDKIIKSITIGRSIHGFLMGGAELCIGLPQYFVCILFTMIQITSMTVLLDMITLQSEFYFYN